MALSHTTARSIVIDAFQRVHGRLPTGREALYVQAVAWLENQYGRAGQFANLAANGQYNWGSLHAGKASDGSCPPGSAPGSDLGSVCFQVYGSDVDAATAFIRNLTARHWPVLQALQSGGDPAYAVAKAMHVAPAYYEGYGGSEEERVQAYASAIRSAASAISRQVPSINPVGVSANTIGWILGLGTLGVLGYGYVRSSGYPRWFPRTIRI